MSTVTLAVVAERAGVTIPTVSKVIHGRSDVSSATRERVLAAIAETGYQSRRAQPRLGFKEGQALIDLVVSDVEGSWANRVLTGVEHAANRAGLDVVVTIDRPADERDWAARLVARRSNGAVLALVEPTAEQYAALELAQIPVVILDPRSEPPEGIGSVGASNWAGGRAAAEHLVALGHRCIGLIEGVPHHLYGQARTDGFRSGLRKYGIAVDQSHRADGAWSFQGGALPGAYEILDRPDRPTAVFASSDPLALGVLDAARNLGISVPEELSVIGFDDAPEARWTLPRLTTIRQPVTEMGAAALRMLLRMCTGIDSPVDHGRTPREELATHLVERSSTAPPAPSGLADDSREEATG